MSTMMQYKAFAAAVLTAVVALTAAGVARSRLAGPGGGPVPDIYGLLEVRWDMPPGWQLWPDYRGKLGEPAGDAALRRWMGSVMRPSEPPSPSNKILSAAHVWIIIRDTPAAAAYLLASETALGRTEVPQVHGSYSGRAIGDRCFRGGGLSGPQRGGTLWFTRGRAYYCVSVDGGPGSADGTAIAERLALALVARYDAAQALATAPQASTTLAGRTVTARTPRGAPVVPLAMLAGARGVQVALDIPEGAATITSGGHTLLLHIGRSEAWLDGARLTLPFPALRDGPGGVWCPVAVLRRLGL